MIVMPFTLPNDLSGCYDMTKHVPGANIIFPLEMYQVPTILSLPINGASFLVTNYITALYQN
jgi:hypothetical protein